MNNLFHSLWFDIQKYSDITEINCMAPTAVCATWLSRISVMSLNYAQIY